jgi:hypothetical protein
MDGFRTDKGQRFARGVETMLSPFQERDHVAAKDRPRQFIAKGVGLNFTQIGPISTMQIDDSSITVDGPDFLSTLVDESNESHRRSPPDETT